MIRGYINKFQNIETGKYTKIAGILIVLVIMILDIIMFKIIIHNKYIENDKKVLSYDVNSIVDYNILLLENDLFDKSTLGPNRIYITNLIDKINTVNKLKLSIDRDSDVQGDYEVFAYLSATLPEDAENRVIWDKKYILSERRKFKDDKDIKISKKSVNINKETEIDIKSYMDFVKDVNVKYDINYTTNLKITWDINIYLNSQGRIINERVLNFMKINLDEKHMQANGDLIYTNSESIKTKIKKIKDGYYIKMFATIIIFIILVILMLYMTLILKIKIDNETDKTKFNKIKKLFGDRIVTITYPLKFVDHKIIQVGEIEDLAKISDDLSKPILYSNYKNNSNNFYVLNENEIYIFKW
ncbi:MAG: DUF5305 family protein [Clostridiales bacterium]